MNYIVDENSVVYNDGDLDIVLNNTMFTNNIWGQKVQYLTLHKEIIYSFNIFKKLDGDIYDSFNYNELGHNLDKVSEIINDEGSNGWKGLPFHADKLVEIVQAMDLNDHQCMKDLHKMIVNMFNRLFDVLDSPGLVLTKSSNN